MGNIMWGFSIILLLFSLYMIGMNWAVFVNNHILKKKWASAVPFVGGIAGSLGLLLLPVSENWKYAWIPLLVDWGSIPVVFISLICCVCRRDHQERSQ